MKKETSNLAASVTARLLNRARQTGDDHLAGRFQFDRVPLTEALRRTFARRRTPAPAEEPIGLTPTYWENPSRAPQVALFGRFSCRYWGLFAEP